MKRSTSLALMIYPVSAVFAVLRMAGVHHEAFQALAHLWVAFLAGLYVGYRRDRMKMEAVYTLSLVVGLSLIELACFLYFGVQS